ncbi:MAG: DNA helicase [Pseudomonadota bacterium]
MKLSKPIYRLKRQARDLSRKAAIPLAEALDQVARAEGFGAWSLLVAKMAQGLPAERLWQDLRPADLALLAARPRQGKTRTALQVMTKVIEAGGEAAFFSLDWDEAEVRRQILACGGGALISSDRLQIDCSDAVSAEHIVSRLDAQGRCSLAVVDYLQLLDQDREKPPVAEQVRSLKRFAADSGITLLLLSQIDRRYDPKRKAVPDQRDVRLPNPLDLSLFTKTCFLHSGRMRVANQPARV